MCKKQWQTGRRVRVKETQPSLDRPQALRAIAQFKDHIILIVHSSTTRVVTFEHRATLLSLFFDWKERKENKKFLTITRRHLLSSVCTRSVDIGLLHWPIYMYICIYAVGRPSSRTDNTFLGLPSETTIKNRASIQQERSIIAGVRWAMRLVRDAQIDRPYFLKSETSALSFSLFSMSLLSLRYDHARIFSTGWLD